MACREVDLMRQQVMSSLQSNVHTWQSALQSRWGDPRVYEAQKVERLKQDAAIAHDLSRRKEEAFLSDAYAKRAIKQRETHTKRIGELKLRNYRGGGKRPVSPDTTSVARMPPPVPMPDPQRRQFPEPAEYSAWPN